MGASTAVARRAVRFVRGVGSLAVSIGAMILGAAVLGGVIAGVSGVVLVVIERSETVSRAAVNLDEADHPQFAPILVRRDWHGALGRERRSGVALQAWGSRLNARRPPIDLDRLLTAVVSEYESTDHTVR